MDNTADGGGILSGDSLRQPLQVHMVSLGCPKNLVDSEVMCGILDGAGFRLTGDPAAAQVIVVNTCGFIESAKQEAIGRILEMADFKRPGGCDFLIAAGCLAQRYPTEIAGSLPEVDAIIGTSEYGRIADVIGALYASREFPPSAEKQPEHPLIHTDRCGDLDYLRGGRIPSTSGYAYLKIAEGCSNCCAYCAIPGIRGPYRSRPIPELIEEAGFLAGLGYYEVVLVAQDTTRYGTDLYGERRLHELVREISLIGGIRKVRILYCYPDGITPELIREIASNPKAAKYIDIPIQHASDSVLRRMNRRDTAASVEATVEALRRGIPDVTIRTTVLVGFPGETARDFDELYAFLRRMEFDLLGCFVFSPEEGTPACDMHPKVPAAIAQSRHRRIMELQRSISRRRLLSMRGEIMTITVEGIAEDGIFYTGRGDAQAPEIDPPVYAAASEGPPAIGSECRVRIVDSSDYELIGVTIP